jgi:YD repeat-containing protein
MKKLIVMFFIFSISSFLYARDRDMSDSQYPDYTMCKIKDRKTIAHLDGIWHDVKVEYDENGLIVYRGVHEKKSPDVQDEDWCVWKYTYDSHGRQTRVQGPLHGKFGWEDKTSDAYWKTTIYPDADAPWEPTYVSEYAGWKQKLTQTGGWNVGYKPTLLRVTFTGAETLFITFKSSNTTKAATLSSVGELSIIGFLGDIDFIGFENSSPIDFPYFEITKIEFGFNPFDTP